MENISDNEKLALLGFDDPQHSLTWYKDRFKNLPDILEKFIIDTLKQYNIFPQEARNLEGRSRYIRFYIIIEGLNNNYVVKINNTDRGEVKSENTFKDMKEASRFLINKSFTMGGSIKQYWEN